MAAAVSTGFVHRCLVCDCDEGAPKELLESSYGGVQRMIVRYDGDHGHLASVLPPRFARVMRLLPTNFFGVYY